MRAQNTSLIGLFLFVLRKCLVGQYDKGDDSEYIFHFNLFQQLQNSSIFLCKHNLTFQGIPDFLKVFLWCLKIKKTDVLRKNC